MRQSVSQSVGRSKLRSFMGEVRRWDWQGRRGREAGPDRGGGGGGGEKGRWKGREGTLEGVVDWMKGKAE